MPCVVFQLRENTLESTTHIKHSILLKYLIDPSKINYRRSIKITLYNYITIVVTPNTPRRLNSKTRSKKRVINVKLRVIKKRKRWEDAIPICYGFFINKVD